MDTTLKQQDQQILQAMQLLADETRFKMFRILLESNGLCVSEISTLLGVSVSAVSQHFRMFELSGMVIKKRHGQKICYAISHGNPVLDDLIEVIRRKD